MGIAILTSVKGHQLACILGYGPFGARTGTVLGESDCRAEHWMEAETDPDSSTTGAWSKPFSRRISMVCSQVTVGSTVSGAERLSS